MKRNEMKTENSIVKALNDVCETLKKESEGFSWLTHFVDYSKFPQSLKLVFVFDTNQNLEGAKNTTTFQTIFQLTETRLSGEGIYIKNIHKSLFFDTEENGADYENEKWSKKYS